MNRPGNISAFEPAQQRVIEDIYSMIGGETSGSSSAPSYVNVGGGGVGMASAASRFLDEELNLSDIDDPRKAVINLGLSANLRNVTNDEATQLANIDSTTISSATWAHLAAINQDLGTGNDVEFRDLKARNAEFTGSLLVYEMEVRKLRYSKGPHIFGPGGGKIDTVTDNGGGSYTITFLDEPGITTDDFLLIQEFNPDTQTVVRQARLDVTASSGTDITADLLSGSAPQAGDDVAVVASGDTGRDSLVYIDPFAPNIDLFDSISNFTDWDARTAKVRVGDMSGMPTVAGATPSGMGVYGENVYMKDAYFEGTVSASAGEITGTLAMGASGEIIYKTSANATKTVINANDDFDTAPTKDADVFTDAGPYSLSNSTGSQTHTESDISSVDWESHRLGFTLSGPPGVAAGTISHDIDVIVSGANSAGGTYTELKRWNFTTYAQESKSYTVHFYTDEYEYIRLRWTITSSHSVGSTPISSITDIDLDRFVGFTEYSARGIANYSSPDQYTKMGGGILEHGGEFVWNNPLTEDPKTEGYMYVDDSGYVRWSEG